MRLYKILNPASCHNIWNIIWKQQCDQPVHLPLHLQSEVAEEYGGVFPSNTWWKTTTPVAVFSLYLVCSKSLQQCRAVCLLVFFLFRAFENPSLKHIMLPWNWPLNHILRRRNTGTWLCVSALCHGSLESEVHPVAPLLTSQLYSRQSVSDHWIPLWCNSFPLLLFLFFTLLVMNSGIQNSPFHFCNLVSSMVLSS